MKGVVNQQMSDLTIAQEILNQLPKTIAVMIGVKQFIGGNNFLSFRWNARSKNGANHVKIELMPSDTYTVTFSRIHGKKVSEVSKHEDIYNDSLRELFEHETGLYLSL